MFSILIVFIMWLMLYEEFNFKSDFFSPKNWKRETVIDENG